MDSIIYQIPQFGLRNRRNRGNSRNRKNCRNRGNRGNRRNGEMHLPLREMHLVLGTECGALFTICRTAHLNYRHIYMYMCRICVCVCMYTYVGLFIQNIGLFLLIAPLPLQKCGGNFSEKSLEEATFLKNPWRRQLF